MGACVAGVVAEVVAEVVAGVVAGVALEVALATVVVPGVPGVVAAATTAGPTASRQTHLENGSGTWGGGRLPISRSPCSLINKHLVGLQHLSSAATVTFSPHSGHGLSWQPSRQSTAALPEPGLAEQSLHRPLHVPIL